LSIGRISPGRGGRRGSLRGVMTARGGELKSQGWADCQLRPFKVQLYIVCAEAGAPEAANTAAAARKTAVPQARIRVPGASCAASLRGAGTA
jgi:hypothetical protein